MPQTLPMPADRRLDAASPSDIDETLSFGYADLLALPVLLLLCIAFFCVGVWDTVHEALIKAEDAR